MLHIYMSFVLPISFKVLVVGLVDYFLSSLLLMEQNLSCGI